MGWRAIFLFIDGWYVIMSLAIVGCGTVANDHLGALRRGRGRDVVALCDKETLARMSRKWNMGTSHIDYCDGANHTRGISGTLLFCTRLYVALGAES